MRSFSRSAIAQLRSRRFRRAATGGDAAGGHRGRRANKTWYSDGMRDGGGAWRWYRTSACGGAYLACGDGGAAVGAARK
jgi:hypothetical protein